MTPRFDPYNALRCRVNRNACTLVHPGASRASTVVAVGPVAFGGSRMILST